MVQGVTGCSNRYVDEETLIKAYLMDWNALAENWEVFMESLKEMDTDLILKKLDHINVFEMGSCWLCSWTETRLNVKMKKSKQNDRLGVSIPD